VAISETHLLWYEKKWRGWRKEFIFYHCRDGEMRKTSCYLGGEVSCKPSNSKKEVVWGGKIVPEKRSGKGRMQGGGPQRFHVLLDNRASHNASRSLSEGGTQGKENSVQLAGGESGESIPSERPK